MQDFLRDGTRFPGRSDADASADFRRQTMVAMDRKRRLTGSGHDEGRRRNNDGNGYHDRRVSGYLSRYDGPSTSSAYPQPQPQRRGSFPHPPAEIIDLTGSSPVVPQRILPLSPTTRPRERRPQRMPSRGSSHSSMPYTVPRWQPDTEVSECPICGRAFGFLFRRHHCRKCGRVVCNDCSPHRITLPRSMIVYPPGIELAHIPARPISGIETVDLTRDEENHDRTDPPNTTNTNNKVDSEAGAKVRLCNPCVPDPQPNPQDQSTPVSTSDVRSQRRAGEDDSMATNPFSLFPRSGPSSAWPRHRSSNSGYMSFYRADRVSSFFLSRCKLVTIWYWAKRVIFVTGSCFIRAR